MTHVEPRTREPHLTWRLDLIQRDFPAETAVLRALLLHSPSCALTMTQVVQESGLAFSVALQAARALEAVHGVKLLAHPSGRQIDLIVWLQRMRRMEQLCAAFPWVAAWHRAAKAARSKPTIKQLFRRRRPPPRTKAEASEWVKICISSGAIA